MQDSTAAALIVAEALHDQAADDIPNLIKTLAAELEATWPLTPRATVLTAASPTFTFADLATALPFPDLPTKCDQGGL